MEQQPGTNNRILLLLFLKVIFKKIVQMKLNPRIQQIWMNPQEQALLHGYQPVDGHPQTHFKLKEQLLTNTPPKTG